MLGVHPNPRLCPQGQEDQGRVCPLSCLTSLSPVLCFPCICLYVTRGNKEERCLLQQLPSRKTQEAPHCHQWSSSLSSILGYCLLHGCCRIGVQPSDHINCDGQRTFGVWQCRHPSIDPVCIVWVERTPGRVWQEKISG